MKAPGDGGLDRRKGVMAAIGVIAGVMVLATGLAVAAFFVFAALGMSLSGFLSK